MNSTKQIHISLSNFSKLTGCEFEHFSNHIMKGDAWATFMKIAAVVEATSKRAIAIRIGIDPSSEGAMRLEFHNAIVLCTEAGLISKEAFEFANYIRHVRNDLAHNGSSLDLDIEKLRGSQFFKKYQGKLESFAVIDGQRISDGPQQHINTLFLGCVVFINELAKSLLNEDWVVPSNAAEGTA